MDRVEMEGERERERGRNRERREKERKKEREGEIKDTCPEKSGGKDELHSCRLILGPIVAESLSNTFFSNRPHYLQDGPMRFNTTCLHSFF